MDISKSQDVNDTIKRIQNHKGVQGTIIVSPEGIAVHTSMDNSTTLQYCDLIRPLAAQARSVVRDLDPTNDLTFLRISSKKNEILVAPEKDFTAIVVQATDRF